MSTTQQRVNWRAFECNEPALKRVVFGPREILVAPHTEDAWKALACVLAAHQYQIRSGDTGSYNCRPITGGTEKSLHAYGIALDVNSNSNPYRKTPDQRAVRYSTKPTQDERAREVDLHVADTDMTPDMIRDVIAIKTNNGLGAFVWGGNWTSIKDTMHFEIALAPHDLDAGIDWSTVRGAQGGPPAVVAWDQGHPSPPVSLLRPALPQQQALGRFELVYPVVEKWEGHFDNDPDDPGGPTNMGITQADLARWRKRAVSVDEVRDLTREEARQIFRAFYWEPIKGDQLPLAASQMCYDSAVLEGLRCSGRFLQQALNQQNKNVPVDSGIGPLTISACADVDLDKLVKDFAALSEAYLRSRPGFPKYGQGWLNRLNDVTAVARSMVSAPPAAIHPTQPATQPAGGDIMATQVQAPDLNALLQQLLALFQSAPQAAPAPAAPTPTPTATPSPLAPDQLRNIIQVLSVLANALATQPAATGATATGALSQLGQVNGALGETIGNLLNGKKSAIGIIGALATSLLSAVPSSGGLGQILAMVTPAAGLSGFAMPIFLAMTAWGVLGKLEKWTQGTAPPPFTSK